MKALLSFLTVVAITLGSLSGQVFEVSGQITDADTKEPLPFVNLVVNSSQKGGISDIHGMFYLRSEVAIEYLRISYVGYQTDTIFINGNLQLNIQLNKTAVLLNEVIILPGENPAHRMIDSAILHRKDNDPLNLNSFSYQSYNKFFITAGLDSLMSIPDERLDSQHVEMKHFFEEHYLFLMENFSERKYLRPGHDNETVLASKVSGFSDPLLTLLNGQIQSFSFYKPLITISDKNYVNPISPGSTSKYLFLIQDSIYDGADTVFVISYRPFKGSAFDGLKGLLYIHSSGWALQAVTAEPAEEQEGMSVKIKQNYSRPDNLHWFPSQLHTEIYFSSLKLEEFPIFGRGVTILDQIKINPPLKKSDFSTAAVTIDPEARFRDSLFWSKTRPDSLTQREKNTYHFIDSLGKKEHFDRLLDMTTTLLSGYIPVGPLALDINALYQHNEVEGSRPGLGLKTNYRVSRKWSLYGYAGYGFRDQKPKFAGELTLQIKRQKQQFIKTGYRSDVRESGSIKSNIENHNLLDPAGLRSYLISRIDYVHSVFLLFHSLAGKSWDASLQFSRAYILSPDSVLFGNWNSWGFAGTHAFYISDCNLRLQYSRGTKYIESENYSLPIGGYSPAPVFTLDLHQSFNGISQHDVVRTALLLQINQTIKTRYAGKFSWLFQTGLVSPDVPLSLAFNGPSSYRSFTISAPNSFETMRMNEFYSTRFAYLFIRHSFESLLFGNRKFSPSPEIVTSIGFGDYSNRSQLNVPDFKTLENGFFESGLYINRILSTGFYALGVGAVVRYGPNRLDRFKDNLTVKLSVSYAL